MIPTDPYIRINDWKQNNMMVPVIEGAFVGSEVVGIFDGTNVGA